MLLSSLVGCLSRRPAELVAAEGFGRELVVEKPQPPLSESRTNLLRVLHCPCQRLTTVVADDFSN